MWEAYLLSAFLLIKGLLLLRKKKSKKWGSYKSGWSRSNRFAPFLEMIVGNVFREAIQNQVTFLKPAIGTVANLFSQSFCTRIYKILYLFLLDFKLHSVNLDLSVKLQLSSVNCSLRWASEHGWKFSRLQWEVVYPNVWSTSKCDSFMYLYISKYISAKGANPWSASVGNCISKACAFACRATQHFEMQTT